MTGKIYNPEDKHPETYQQDLAPDASKGINYGKVGPPTPTRTAYDFKRLPAALTDYSPDELKQIRILEEGARLETGATYLNLADDSPQEIQARGDEVVGQQDFYLAKKDIPYEWWNRLLGNRDPRRTNPK
ncbi:MAG: hypothetical protein ACYC0X_07595 [Pirellulaceae bacterium]